MFKNTAIIITVLFFAGFTAIASAGTITQYTDRATFDAAVGSTVLEDFLSETHFPIPSGVLNDLTNEAGIVPGDIQSGVTYSTAIGPGNFFNIDAGGGFTGGMLDRLSTNEPLMIDFDAPTTAFGFDTNNLMGAGFTYNIQFTDGSSSSGSNLVVDNTSMQFFGFQSSATDIESVTIQTTDFGSNFAFIIDNFAFTSNAGIVITIDATPVPTVSTYGLLFMILGVMVLTRRRFTKSMVKHS
jgi:hypothetical protein